MKFEEDKQSKVKPDILSISRDSVIYLGRMRNPDRLDNTKESYADYASHLTDMRHSVILISDDSITVTSSAMCFA